MIRWPSEAGTRSLARTEGWSLGIRAERSGEERVWARGKHSWAGQRLSQAEAWGSRQGHLVAQHL